MAEESDKEQLQQSGNNRTAHLSMHQGVFMQQLKWVWLRRSKYWSGQKWTNRTACYGRVMTAVLLCFYLYVGKWDRVKNAYQDAIASIRGVNRGNRNLAIAQEQRSNFKRKSNAPSNSVLNHLVGHNGFTAWLVQMMKEFQQKLQCGKC